MSGASENFQTLLFKTYRIVFSVYPSAGRRTSYTHILKKHLIRRMLHNSCLMPLPINKTHLQAYPRLHNFQPPIALQRSQLLFS